MNYLLLNVFGTISLFQLINGRTITPAINDTIVEFDCSSPNVTSSELRTAICGSHVGAINIDEKETNKKFIPIAIVALLIGIIICGTIYLTFYLKRKKSAKNGKVESQEQSKPIEELKIHEIKSDANKKTVTNETKDNGKDQPFYSQSIVPDDQLDEVSLSD
uniref:Uncharacterized protein n=1 Tax=Tetranychus urticae TaxID=32264 RepID=T1KPU1_TETUR